MINPIATDIKLSQTSELINETATVVSEELDALVREHYDLELKGAWPQPGQSRVVFLEFVTVNKFSRKDHRLDLDALDSNYAEENRSKLERIVLLARRRATLLSALEEIGY